MSGEKTEDPTPKKVKDAREKGQVAKSQDLTASVLYIVGFGVMAASASSWGDQFQQLFRSCFAAVSRPPDVPMLLQLARDSLVWIPMLLMPFLGAMFALAVLINYVQVGPLLSFKSMKPDIMKLNPITGIKNVFFKARTYVELIKNGLKLGVASYLVYGVMKSYIYEIVLTLRFTPMEIGKIAGEIIVNAGIKVGVFYLFVAVLDIFWQRHQHTKELRMSKDEVKKEYKQDEGDPQQKARRQQLHQELSQGSMLEDVKTADAVVVNPDHLAAAIKYDQDNMAAPRIIAKGSRVMAEKIKAIAKEHGVPILRNVPLAQALSRLEIGQDIPEDLYDAVAEILNFVYGLSERAP